MNSAIIVAAGSSRRMGFDKLLHPLRGKPVVAHSILAFEATPEIDEIIVVARSEQMKVLKDLVSEECVSKVSRFVAGGDERHLSVWNGLQALDTASEHVAIHDGARPLVTPALIRACLRLAQSTGAACCASPIADTVKRASADQFVTESVDRAGLWAMQTPQIFSRKIVVDAYADLIAKNELVTDEVSAVQRHGTPVSLLRNDDWNFKITFPNDLEMAEQVLAMHEKKARGIPLSQHQA